MGQWQLGPVLALGVVVIPAVALAGNGTHPRTPVQWVDVPCATTVDRSIDPVFHLPYSIPYEDTDVTADEVEDSRRHQFFAFCRDFDPTSVPPAWVAAADVQAAAAKGLAEPELLGVADVLETNTELEGCWWRITADDERRPITQAMADEGVQWDTSQVDPGVYKLYGYTYEPAYNLWSKRPGFVRVVDEGDPATIGPAVAGAFDGEPIFFRNDTGELHACVDAMAGSTLSAHWSVAAAGVAPDWTPFLEEAPASSGTNILTFPVPSEAAGQSIMIRMEVKDPEGRVHSAYVPDIVVVLAQDRPGGCSGDDCDDQGSDDGGGSDDGMDSDPPAECEGTDADDTCTRSCRIAQPASPAGLLFGLWAIAARRRRSIVT